MERDVVGPVRTGGPSVPVPGATTAATDEGRPGAGARGEGLGLVAGAVAGSLFLLELVLLAAASPPKGTDVELAHFLGTHRFVSAVVACAGVAGAALLVPFAAAVVARAWRHRAAAPWVGWTALLSTLLTAAALLLGSTMWHVAADLGDQGLPSTEVVAHARAGRLVLVAALLPASMAVAALSSLVRGMSPRAGTGLTDHVVSAGAAVASWTVLAPRHLEGGVALFVFLAAAAVSLWVIRTAIAVRRGDLRLCDAGSSDRTVDARPREGGTA